ncbi:hypothetical protein K438DRAFT_1837548 [Mycena galopus ATCC 62051]|nr:hypothetical protein K438DRAFT_1837548 [Mycena galopus ATCC 62051]
MRHGFLDSIFSLSVLINFPPVLLHMSPLTMLYQSRLFCYTQIPSQFFRDPPNDSTCGLVGSFLFSTYFSESQAKNQCYFEGTEISLASDCHCIRLHLNPSKSILLNASCLLARFIPVRFAALIFPAQDSRFFRARTCGPQPLHV